MRIVFSRAEAQAIVSEELNSLKARIIDNMRNAGAVASGRTIASLKVVPTETGSALVSDERMPFGTLETGRRGGRIPAGFTAIILDWMRSKGIQAQVSGNRSQESADRSLAYLISRKIAREGTSLFRRGGRNTIYSQEIPKTVAAVERRIGALFDAYVEESIKLNNETIGG